MNIYMHGCRELGEGEQGHGIELLIISTNQNWFQSNTSKSKLRTAENQLQNFNRLKNVQLHGMIRFPPIYVYN